MSQASDEAILEALRVLTNPEDRETMTVADLQDVRLITYCSSLITLGNVLGDDCLKELTKNFLILSRSRKRKGSKEIVEILRGARARVLQTTVLSGVKRVLVGRSGEVGELEE